jgi:hypothetical protein
MKNLFAACCAAFLLVVIVAPLAHAATEVNVRIEGKEETLFEKTIPVAIHPIEASSDTEARQCYATDELETEPAATPTLASAEAMESIGETFDATWFGGIGPLGDYFLTRFGPDEQDNALSAWWGILVNNTLTSVGGCQTRLKEDDEVLWVWNAFDGRSMLALFPEAADYEEGPRPTRVVAEAGEPVSLEVVSYGAGGEGVAPESPSRLGSSAYEGAEIAPVTVGEKGFQRIDTASPEAVFSDAEGKAIVTYDTPGVYRVKATEGPLGIDEPVVRSNGLEICVEGEPGECEPSTAGGGSETPGTEAPAGGTRQPTTSGDQGGAGTAPVSAAPVQTPVRIGHPRLDRSDLASGRLKLSWAVLDPGAGVKSWQVSARALGQKGGWINRARGTTQTGATVRLPRGHRYQLRLTVTDLSGHTITYSLGKVAVPGAGRG